MYSIITGKIHYRLVFKMALKQRKILKLEVMSKMGRDSELRVLRFCFLGR